MRRFVTLCAALLLATSASADSTTYGDGVTLDTATPIETLLENPEKFVGTNVRVNGSVTAVCQDQGCWLDISDPESGASIRIKVEDGVIVFPTSAVGARVSAQGVLEKVAGEGCAHQAEAKAHRHAGCARHAAAGKDTEHGDARGGATFRIRGTGAVITSGE